MHRFFVSPDHIQGGQVLFSLQQAHQIARVLRLRPGQRVLVLDNTGASYQVELSTVNPAVCEGTVVETARATGEPQVRLTLFQALLKGEKWEYVLQKGTELGVSAFVPTRCQRCVSRYSDEAWQAKSKRWQTILREAAEQSGRGQVPELRSPVSWERACREATGLALLAYEGEKNTSLRDVLATCQDTSQVSLFVGPEGGLTEEEVALAQGHGVRPVSLGRRILRAETAGLAATAAIFYALGELG